MHWIFNPIDGARFTFESFARFPNSETLLFLMSLFTKDRGLSSFISVRLPTSERFLSSRYFGFISDNRFNDASGISSVVSGGNFNVASGQFTSVSGGYDNEASGT